MNSQILLFIIKLILGGVVAFLSILIMSKTREPAWMMIVAGFISLYALLVYELLLELGVLSPAKIHLAGIPLPTLIFAAIPNICFIVAFILKLNKK